MGAVLVEDVVDVDEDGAQVLDLVFGVRGVPRHDACEFEEVEQQGLCKLLKLKSAVLRLGVLCVSGCSRG